MASVPLSPARDASLLYGVPGALLTALVLIAGVTLTWIAWRATAQAEERGVRDALAVHAADVQLTLENRLLAHEGLLRAGAGMLGAVWPLTAQQWRVFCSQLSLAAVYPGVRGVGFAAPIRSSADVEYWSRVAEPLGFGKRIATAAADKPLPETLIVLIEPLDARNRRAVGYDMMSDPVRRAAMERARDQGKPALSAKVRLVQEFAGEDNPGFILYLPVYETVATPGGVEERRSELRGFVYSPFRAIEFFSDVLDLAAADAVFEVYDGAQVAPEALLYRSARRPQDERASQIRWVSVAGHTWTLRVLAGEKLAGPLPSAAQIVAISGSAITVLLALVVSVLALSRQRLRERIDADRALAQQERVLKQTLELRVAERTAQLEDANRELCAANRDLEAFAYSVSHDLRAPLRAIDGHAARLVEAVGPLDERQQYHAVAVRRNIRQMTQLIDDLLSFALVSRRPIERRRVDLWALLRPILEDIRLVEPIEIDVDPQQLGEVYADPGLLRQALVNLLDNAAKFSRGRNPPRISIGCQQGPGERVYFVRDNGVGFDMRYAGKLFGVFERLHQAGEFEGMGVGLAIVKQIIERHGGRIWAQAEPGCGATFYFTLPERAQQEQAA